MMSLLGLKPGPHHDHCDGFSKVYHEYFADVSNGKLLQEGGQDYAHSLYTTTMHHLSQCCSNLSKDKVSLEPEVVKITEHCFQCYSQLCQAAFVSFLDSARVVKDLKIFLYIVNKLIGKASFTTYMNLSSHILGILKTITETNNELCDLITKLYSCVWNAAITFERMGQVTPLEVCLLRLSSLQVLAQRPSARESCLEKIALALNVFEHRWKVKPEKQEESDAKEVPDALRTVFSQVLGLLNEAIRPGEVKAHSVLTLSIAVYDFLASFQRLELASILKTKLLSLTAGEQCGTKESTIQVILNHFWAVTDVSAYLNPDLAETKHGEANLTSQLKNIVRFVKQMQLSTIIGNSDFFIDVVHWFEKQIKASDIRKDVFWKPDNLNLLQQFFRETQTFLALYIREVNTAGKSGSSSLSQSERDKVTKTYLDAHRCWLLLYYKALSEHFSPETADYMNKISEQAPEQLTAYAQAIDAAAHSSSLQLNERYFLGSMCVKLGHILYNQKKDKQSIPFYSQACDQLTLWCHGDSDDSCDSDHFAVRMREASLLKLFNCLSQSQHKVGLLDDAMATIVQAVTITKRHCEGMHNQTTEHELFAGLIATWIKLKRSALKESGKAVDPRLGRSFTDEATFCVDQVNRGLELELHELMKGTVRPRLLPVEGAVLKSLCQTSQSERRKDINQLFLLQFDVLTNAPLETFREDLDQHLDSLVTKYPDHPSMQAEVCLIRFCLQVKHKVEGTFPLADNDPKAGGPNVRTHEKMIGEEEKELVRAALRGWELALQTGDVCFMPDCSSDSTRFDRYSEHVQRKIFKDMLMMVADVLMACREFLLQLEVLVVAKRLMAGDLMPTLDLDRLDIDISVMDALTGLGVEDLPAGLAHLTLDDEKDAGRRDSFHLSLIAFYLQAGKVKEVYPLLNQLRDRELKGELSSLHRGKYKRLLGECLRVDPALSQDQDYVLTLAQAAYRLHFSLFSRIDTEQNFRPGHNNGDDSVWFKLVELLESTLFLGRMFRHTGDARRARCYLKEGRALCEKFGLLKWYTVFSLELAESLLEAEELVCFLDALWSTYSNLSRLEPRPNCIKYSKLLVNTSIKPMPTSPTLTDLAKACSKVFEEDRKQLCCESSEITICPGFWPRLQFDKLKKSSTDIVCTQLWQKLALDEQNQTAVDVDWEQWEKVQKKQQEELDRKAADVVGWILSWSKFLVGHSADCWCLMCSDAESQLLALALAKTSVKFVHYNFKSAEHHLKQFFNSVVKLFKRVDKSMQVTQALQAAQLIGQSDAVKCGDVRHILCFTEVSCFLAETQLQGQNVHQALAHTKVGLLVVNRVPQQIPEAVLLKSRLVHLYAVCLHEMHHAARQGRPIDWKEFPWCRLSETQLELQVRTKLEQLKVRVPIKKPAVTSDRATTGSKGDKVSKSSPSNEGSTKDKPTASCDEVSGASGASGGLVKVPSNGEDVAASSCPESVKNKSKPTKASNGGVKGSVVSVSSSAGALVGSSVGDKTSAGRKDSEKNICETSTSSNDEVVGGSSVKDKTTTGRKGKKVKKDASSDEVAEQSSHISTTKNNKSVKVAEYNSLSHEAGDAKPGQNSHPGDAKPGKTSQLSDAKRGQISLQSTIPPNVLLLASDSDSPNETTGRKRGVSKIPVRPLAAQMKKKQGKKSGLTSSSASSDSATPVEMDSVSFTGDSASNEKPFSNQNWATPFHTPQSVHSKPPETPASLIKQVLSFTSNFSDSGDEFQPSTPVSTPKPAGRTRRTQTQRKVTTHKELSPGPGSRENVSLKSGQPSRRTATKPGQVKTRQGSVSVEVLEQELSYLGLSAASDHHRESDAVRVPGKAKPAPKATKRGRNPTTKTRGGKGVGQDLSVETLQEDLARLSLSREGDGSSPCADTVNPEEEKFSASVQETKVSMASERRGRRGRGKASSENADGEETSGKAKAGSRQAKCLNSRSLNVPSETSQKAMADQGKVVLSAVTDVQISAAGPLFHTSGVRIQPDKSESVRKRPGRPKQAAKVENLDAAVEAVQVPSAAGSRTAGRGGRKPGNIGKAPQGRRGAAARTAKDRTATKTAADVIEVIPEIEIVRGGDEDEMVAHEDIFDFDESDGESKTLSKKGKKRQIQVKKGKAKCPTARAHGASIKQAVPKTHTKTPKTAASVSKLASPDQGELTQTNAMGDPHTDMSSAEKMRMCDLTNRGSVGHVQVKHVDCDPLKHDSHAEAGLGCAGGCEGCRVCKTPCRCSPQSDSHQTREPWHEESLLTYFQAAGKKFLVDEEEIGGGLPEGVGDAVSLEIKGDALHNVQIPLTRSLSLSQHFPHNSMFSESCKVLAQIKLDMGEDPWEIVALLGESAAISLRHQFLSHFHKQIRIKEAEERGKQTQNLSNWRADFSDLVFPWDAQKYKEVVQSLPRGWTVCQFTVVDSPGCRTLMLTRLTSHQEPLTVELPRFFDKTGQDIFFSFKKEILDTTHHSRITDTAKWWHRRATVDCKLTNIMEGMDKHWLGAWRGMLAGQSSDPVYNKAMSIAAVKLAEILLRDLGYKCPHSKAMQVLELMQHTRCLATILAGVLKLGDVSENAALLSTITTDVLKVMPVFQTPDLPVVFIPDKHLANLPLEQLGVARNQAVSRVPSLPLLHHLLKMHANNERAGGEKQSVMQRGINPKSVFYVLNPDGDLAGTEQILKPHFDRYGWKGVTANAPSKVEYEEALASHDLFVYSGHGSGSKYYSSEDVQKTACRAVAMLFGCGSVKFDLHPHLDLNAYFYSYLLAGSPCVLGNLWDVTATDIDKFCTSICQQWLSEDGEPQPTLASLLPKARSACTMQSLNGCAPVLYGLPVPLNRPKR